MYDDPSHIRDRAMKLSLSDDEFDVIRAIARLNKRQPSAFAREIVLQAIEHMEQLSGESRAA